MREIILFGASGNIGSQTLRILKNNPQDFSLVAISVGQNVTNLATIIADFPSIKQVWVLPTGKIDQLQQQYPHLEFFSNEPGFDEILASYPQALVVNAISGFGGLYPTLASLQTKNRQLLLANKESLVLAGDLINQLITTNNCTLYPVDSEHCAIFQCLETNNHLNKILLTASGGMFANLSLAKLATIDDTAAFSHPTWKMGAKITIDSSSMMNKALEILEVYHLFKTKNIEVLIHPQSIVHSAVQYDDYSIIAQLSVPNMEQVISYFLYYPIRKSQVTLQPLDFSNLTLTFQPADPNRWVAIKLAFQCLSQPNSLAVVMNAANETLRALFIAKKIRFYEIVPYVEYFMQQHQPRNLTNYQEIKELNDIIKREVNNFFEKSD
ncbi:1-deoxy-D-xylulose-5-phosphate reductoisomerase [Spiroplasma sp. DGKH1]|uniref:1-deoxy-D-xylulose-5-phosphate reductoisomerase n=1 Tax=Spiroplasma sp. DGKH1 TaxID=3050074 RepID=UPI0034C5E91A